MAMRGPDFQSRSDTSPLYLFLVCDNHQANKTTNGEDSLREGL